MATETRKALDAVELLMQDHRELESLFAEFDYLQRTGEDTTDVIDAACAELKIHDTLENDVFYPAVSDAARDDAMEALLDEAEDAHDAVLDLIEHLELMRGDAKQHNAHFEAIVQLVTKHIDDEESRLFPKLALIERLDLDAVAVRMKARQGELMADGAPSGIAAANA
jgi:hemerythrin superfamily protein